MTDLITVNQLTKNFDDELSGIPIQVLTGIDLTVKEGAFLSLQGPSGSGKTTFLSILGGNLALTTGEVFVNELPLHELNENELELYRKNYCGYFFQDSHDNVVAELTVIENLELIMNIVGYPKKKRNDRIKEILQAFDIWNRRFHRIMHLSGGEALRASLATALVNEPSILLCDEPTGELDSETSILIIEYLRRINREFGTTIIAANHNPQFNAYVDATYFLTNGTLAFVNYSGDHTYAVKNTRDQITIPPEILRKYQFKRDVKFIEDPVTHRVYFKPKEASDEM